jgi:hypothetical protein
MEKIIMTNMNNTQKANEIKFPTNGNCKRVKDITTGKEYGSITETAIILGVTGQAVSAAIKNEGWCKGHRLILVKDLHDNIDTLCEESAKANARADRAEAKISEMETEMAEYRKWKAEQEAKRKAEEEVRKAEEARLERERKEEEKRQKLIAQKKNKIAQYEAEVERRKAKLAYAEQKLMCAEIELEALMDNGKEVV